MVKQKKIKTLHQRKVTAKSELKAFIEKCGGRASQRWRVSIKQCESTNRYRICYLFGKKKFRSKNDAVRFLGLEPISNSNSGKKASADKKKATRINVNETENLQSKKAIHKLKKNKEQKRWNSNENERKLANTENDADKTQNIKEDGRAFSKIELPEKLVSWQCKKVEQAPEMLKTNTEELLRDGYTIFKNVLSSELVRTLLHGRSETPDSTSSSRMTMRKRKGNQEWMGAVQTMHAHIKLSGDTEKVLGPLTTRAPGRYDMPLPVVVHKPIIDRLMESSIINFLRFVCPRGKWRTHDILLSKPGSTRQVIHTDSSWDGKKGRNPAIHYLTVLIPLTLQDKATGGTRIWPKTHRIKDAYQYLGDKDYVDALHPLLKVGDALVFDGLLSHCGMENRSGIIDDKARDRYFYYGAFASGHDPNTDVTGS